MVFLHELRRSVLFWPGAVLTLVGMSPYILTWVLGSPTKWTWVFGTPTDNPVGLMILSWQLTPLGLALLSVGLAGATRRAIKPRPR